MKRIVKPLLFSLFVMGCNVIHAAQEENTQTWDWSSDVIGIKEMQLSADYWVEQTENSSQVLKDQQQIAEFNQQVFSTDQYMVDLAAFPQQLTGQQVTQNILSISKPNSSDLYDTNGVLLGPEGYDKYTAQLALEEIPDSVQVMFALVVSRSDMRTYPTQDRFYKSQQDQNLDRFQENGLFPGDALAVLHFSADHKWAFVQSFNYAAWVRTEHIAIGERQAIQQYKNAKHFLVVTGAKVFTSFNPEVAAVSELQLDMGIQIPLVAPADRSNNLYGQNPYSSYTVLLPVRNDEGFLEIKQALIARNQDVNKGFIPFTRENITRQAFKFLGERYGWGHSFNARDCTGFVSEVYKSFGIFMPRNSGQQGKSIMGENTRFTEESSSQMKLQELKSLDTGDLIYIPGHVMMFIGNAEGQPYVIHDVSGLSYFDADGDFYKGVLNGVSVTPLIPLQLSQETSYIDRMYNIKKIR
jgi:hypothetical protein